MMANITAAQVKQLREMTDSPMMECKKALVEADGDMDAAVDILRKNGLAAAAKKAGRETNEGAVGAFVSDDATAGALCEVACETDFVGMNDKFKAYAEKIAKAALAALPIPINYGTDTLMDPEDIANVIAFLVSPLAHGINGNVLFVDGGTDALLNSEKVY
mgnify:CR=1 FL=1